MCGICGILNLQNSQPIDRTDLDRMSRMMAHRGPDDSGTYVEGSFGMASQRLAILDLSPQGHMPMASPDGRYWIIHNGEIYNYAELRNGLESKGIHFHSNSDTEVLLQLFIEDGPAMLERCQGMFAFVIWDTQAHVLFAARDRMGVKPFYYALHNGRFYFASEEKSLFAAGVPKVFEETTWPELLFFRYIAGERTPFRWVSRLLPGHFLQIRDGNLNFVRWWALHKVILPNRESDNFPENVERFRRIFDHSIALRRISDVPVGALLSGGLDSGAMAATMSTQVGDGIESFTMRFAESFFDEGLLARQVAQRWGMTHHELYLPPEQIPAVLDDSTWYLDAPIVHGNDLHLLAIARYAKQHVTVLLSGEGADEILGGYVRYIPFRYPWLMESMRAGLNLFDAVIKVSGRLNKTANIFSLPNWRERVLFSSADVFPKDINLPNGWDATLAFRRQIIEEACQVYTEPIRQVMYYEQHTYLQSILDRNDRSTMGASIECREPFLDLGLVEWAANLPTAMLFSGAEGKRLLRVGMNDRLPRDIIHHKKWGFGVPWGDYLRQIPSLRAKVQALPRSEVIRSCPVSQSVVQQQVDHFLAGDNQALPLIRLLTFVSIWHSICIEASH